MKRTLFQIVLLLSFMNATDAQWYKWQYRQCDVMDINNCTPEEFECMWNKATIIARGGSISTGIGAASYVLAMVLAFGAAASESISEAYIVTVLLLATGGITAVFIGLPIWITGAVRKSQLKKIPTMIHLLNSDL